MRGLSQSPAMGPEPGGALWEAREAIRERSLQNRHAPYRISEDTSGPPANLLPTPFPHLRVPAYDTAAVDPSPCRDGARRRPFGGPQTGCQPARICPPPSPWWLVWNRPLIRAGYAGPARPGCDPQPGAGRPGTESAGRAGMTGCAVNLHYIIYLIFLYNLSYSNVIMMYHELFQVGYTTYL